MHCRWINSGKEEYMYVCVSKCTHTHLPTYLHIQQETTENTDEEKEGVWEDRWLNLFCVSIVILQKYSWLMGSIFHCEK